MARATNNSKAKWEHVCATNCTLSLAGNIFTITVDVSQSGELSSSGKSFNVGTTSGFVRLGSPHDDVSASLNVIRKR